MSEKRLFSANSAFGIRNEPRNGRKPPKGAGQWIDKLTAIGTVAGLFLGRRHSEAPGSSDASARPGLSLPDTVQQARRHSGTGAPLHGVLQPAALCPGAARYGPREPRPAAALSRSGACAGALRQPPGLPGLGIRRLCHIIMD